ncbi:MAG TPA: DegV family protein [Clostridia bacterium]|nr:DegV family protein [Clostridia bacterium]
MGKIKIVTDSTAYIKKEYAERRGIEIVPLTIHFEGNVEKEGYPGEFEHFFTKLKNSQSFPTTSQPSAGSFAEVFRELVENGNEVIAITISGKLSGTFGSASMAAQMIAPDKISVIDSRTTAANLKVLVEKLLEMCEETGDRMAVVEAIEKEKKKTGISLTVETLDYLQRGGRLTPSQAFLGNLLKVKPIIALVDGALEPVDKVRGKKKAVSRMIECIPGNAEILSICHILSEDEAKEYMQVLRKAFPDARITIEELGPVIGAHLGPKAIGICYCTN